MPFQKGNRIAAKDKACAEALRLAFYADNRALLRKMAQKLAEKAADGDLGAAKEVMDRLDGKPAQSLELTGDIGNASPEELSTNELLARIERYQAALNGGLGGSEAKASSESEPDSVH